jgi:hypothetical protein
LRTFVRGNSDYPNRAVLARRLQAYLRWLNAHARHPDVLAAQRRERARIRSERQQRWGRPKPKSRMTDRSTFVASALRITRVVPYRGVRTYFAVARTQKAIRFRALTTI